MEVSRAKLVTDASGDVIVELQTDAAPPATESHDLNVTLVSHEEIASEFFANLNCKHQGEFWLGKFRPEPTNSRRILEVTSVRHASQSLPIRCEALFVEPESPGEWINGDGAYEQLDDVKERRRQLFEVPIKTEGAAEDCPSFRVVMLVDNLLLTRPQLVPGIQVLPISGPLVSASNIAALNSILGSFGFDQSWDPNRLPPHIAQQRPTAALVAPHVLAPTGEEAQRKCVGLARRLLDLFALRRGDTPRLLLGAIGRNHDGSVLLEGLWLEGAGYKGNLAGGFISGEDQHGLLAQWNMLDTNPRIRLWISLYADALADPRWDYRALRCFNLLEGIASEILPQAAQVLDPSGAPFPQPNGRPYTTTHARGKIYQLVCMVTDAMNEATGSHVPNAHASTAPSLWEWIGMWVSIRNEVAHTGSWDIPDGQTASAKHEAIKREIESIGGEHGFAGGVEVILGVMMRTVDSTLIAFLSGRL
ncbi:hypothetical protein [Micromonospora sp. NBC_00858]|uniref:hypothetical protein n=1 Tax=Micromonospora sp. NBC_00858 TaxID=2975979 RepID=UPI003865D310|nr:hypothetical protein OG990_16160 [Micromonospora sp. NBC_00858]